jgi:transcriptional regulator of heat shock response
MAVKEAKISLTITFEIDEEQLREIFDSYEIKFTKKKVKELQAEMDYGLDNVQVDMEERFQEIVEEWIQNQFDE